MLAITSEEKLRYWYSKIPDFNCVRRCTACCGPHPWADVENRVIAKWLEKRGRKAKFNGAMFDSCLYIEDHQCSIYEVRPVMCRLFGVVDSPKLMCPHRSAKDRISDEEAREMLREIFELP